jgi:RNA polymerase sigma-70 factor (ECF subfamily)
MDATGVFESQRPRLLALAYRMLGGVSDAEDIVQDAWLRWERAETRTDVDTPPAYLRAMVTRLCIDRLRHLKTRRETYVGPWLPEPVPEDMLAGTGEEAQALAESLRFGVLMLLERLTPVQRAVFVLRELLDCEYDEVAAATGRSAATCRQIFLRARARLGEDLPARGLPREQAEAVVGDFLGALAARDLPRLTALLTEDAVAIADHGGKAQAAQRPVHGADRVARLMRGLADKGARNAPVQPTFEVTRLGGGLGLVTYLGDLAVAVICFEVRGDQIAQVHFVRNPDKLRHLDRAPAAAAG